MEESSHEIYSERQIQAGTFLGGPLVAGYFFAQNFRTFNERDKARKSLIISVVVTVLLFGGLMIIPAAEKIPNAVIPILNGVVALGLVRAFQSKSIREYTGPAHTWANTIFVSVGILVITLIPIVGIAYYSYATSTVSEKTYGRMQHGISFDKTNISEAEVDSIGAVLRKWTYFDDEVKKSVDLKKDGNTYVLALYCNESIRTDPGATKPFEELQHRMQTSFPFNPIVLDLVIGTPDNIAFELKQMSPSPSTHSLLFNSNWLFADTPDRFVLRYGRRFVEERILQALSEINSGSWTDNGKAGLPGPAFFIEQ